MQALSLQSLQHSAVKRITRSQHNGSSQLSSGAGLPGMLPGLPSRGLIPTRHLAASAERWPKPSGPSFSRVSRARVGQEDAGYYSSDDDESPEEGDSRPLSKKAEERMLRRERRKHRREMLRLQAEAKDSTPWLTMLADPTSAFADPRVPTIGRAVIAVFVLMLLYGGAMTSILTETFLPSIGSAAVSYGLVMSSLGPLTRKLPGFSTKMLSAVLGYLSFTAVADAITSAAQPLFSLPPYLVLTFCFSTAAIFLLPVVSTKTA